MIQNIGLMMTCNEDDIVEQVMTEYKKHFDKILVLDGSSDRTEEIIRSFDNVVYFLKESDIYPKRKVRDGIRQFLLEKAQDLYGSEGWFTLLHGDEIFVDDPNKIAAAAEKEKAEKVNWHVANFFLHNSQKNWDFSLARTLEEQLPYYQLGGLEIRQFKNKANCYFPLNQHHSVLPKGIGFRPLLDYPLMKHYPIRSPQQFRKKLQLSNRMVRFNDTENEDGIFQEKYMKERRKVFKFDGDFGKWSPGKRPSFWRQFLDFGFL